MKRKHAPPKRLGPFTAVIVHHWPAMVLGVMLSLLAAMASIGLLSLSGWFLAASAYAGLNVTTAQAFNFFLPSIGVRLLAMARTLSRYGERIVSHEATFRILESLRGWCYGRIEPLVPARLARYHSGDLLSRIITDIDSLDQLYLRVLSPSIVALIVAIVLVAAAVRYHPAVGWFLAPILFLAGVGLPLLSERLSRPSARRLNRESARLREHVADGLHGLAALLTCGAQADYLRRMDRRHRRLVLSQGRLSTVTGLTTAGMHLLGGAAVLGILWLGIPAVQAGTLAGPHLALLCLAVAAGFEIISGLPQAYQFLGQARKAAHRLLEVTQAAPAVTYPSAAPPPPGNPDLAFEMVCFRYASAAEETLSDVTLHIPSGRHLAIMGPTGAGKSTLLYLLARFEDPAHGIISLGGRPLSAFDEHTLRQSICIVDQRAHIFNGTLRDNLRIAAPRADDRKLHHALTAVRLQGFVRRLPHGLDTWVGEAGRLLSGGQARRLAVARAVLSPAPIWALDEPTEGLDGETALAMLTALFRLGREKTILMVTHRAEAIERMDRVVVLERGRVAATGRPRDLAEGDAAFNALVRRRIHAED